MSMPDKPTQAMPPDASDAVKHIEVKAVLLLLFMLVLVAGSAL